MSDRLERAFLFFLRFLASAASSPRPWRRDERTAAWAKGKVQPAVRWPGRTCTSPFVGRTSRLMLTA